MKKPAIVLTLILVLFSTGPAHALVYEYYEGSQYVGEGQQYNFFFDLVLNNWRTTNSNLALMDDVKVGWDNIPLESAYLRVNLYSVDQQWEHATIKLYAFYDDSRYFFHEAFNGDSVEGDTTKSFRMDISDTSFVNDPWGKVGIRAVLECRDGNYNDFAITHVGIGGVTGGPNDVAPVPEPATMLLLGSGLIGVACVSRKKTM